MFSITLICMGKLKEKFYTEAAAEYAKRLKAYCAFQLIELPECRLPEDPSAAQIAQGLQKEAELIRAKLPKGCFFCVLTPEGRLLSSEQLADTLRAGLRAYERKIAGYTAPEAILTGLETRTSSPVRLKREENFECTQLAGLYPCGEGAGYAGGIMSAAVDGMLCAEAVMHSGKKEEDPK